MITKRIQRGFAFIAAIMLLVVMAILATAMIRLNVTQQTGSTQDFLGSRASQAARGGLEWGIARLRTTPCNEITKTLTDFHADSGFNVTVTCRTSGPYNEGELADGTPDVKLIHQIDAVACNLGATCPNNAEVANVDYVERRRVVTVCLRSDRTDC